MGSARLTAWGTLVLDYEWGAPHAGRGRDEFRLDAAGRLIVSSVIQVGGTSAAYDLVYNRKR